MGSATAVIRSAMVKQRLMLRKTSECGKIGASARCITPISSAAARPIATARGEIAEEKRTGGWELLVTAGVGEGAAVGRDELACSLPRS